MFVDLKVKIQ